jgi:hypothetical protein
MDCFARVDFAFTAAVEEGGFIETVESVDEVDSVDCEVGSVDCSSGAPEEEGASDEIVEEE